MAKRSYKFYEQFRLGVNNRNFDDLSSGGLKMDEKAVRLVDGNLSTLFSLPDSVVKHLYGIASLLLGT